LYGCQDAIRAIYGGLAGDLRLFIREMLEIRKTFRARGTQAIGVPMILAEKDEFNTMRVQQTNFEVKSVIMRDENRPIMRNISLTLCMAASLLLYSCATDSKIPGAIKVTKSTCPYQISTLDKAELTFADGSTKELIVTHEGTVDVPSGARRVLGESVTNFTAMLKAEYPTATGIEIKEFKDNRFSVLGEVFHQIHTELGNGPMRLMDAIASANGFTPLADRRHVRLVRENAGEVTTYELDFRELLKGENMKLNRVIEAGDVITVPRNFL